MIRKLLLLLVVTTILQNTSYGQGAEIVANAYWRSADETVVIRLALRNPTGSNTGQMKFVGMRFGFQYNDQRIAYAGYQSYMIGLNDPNPSYLNFIGPDTGPGAEDYDSPSFRTATLSSGGSKLMQRRYINRSTNICNNAIPINAGETAVLLDIFFKLKSGVLPSFYNLDQPDYGYGNGSGNNRFIAQMLDKWSIPNNNPHNANLTNDYKDIAVIVFRIANATDPYQPFDASNCEQGNFNPISIGKEDLQFISPINGILAGKAIDANVQDKDNHVLVQWKSENNALVDYFEVQRKEGNGEFKTIGLVMGKEGAEAVHYEFKDKITARDIEPSYRIKVINSDKIITYSDVKKIRLSSEQSVTVKVFPNPSSGSVRINLPVSNGVFVCRMYSTEGRMVQVANVSAANPTVSIKSLQTGSYFMELYQPQTGKRFYTQFSKQ